MNVGAPELLVVLVVALLLFGPAKLPSLARSIGEAQREFRRGNSDKDAAPNAADHDNPEAGTVPSPDSQSRHE
ncbi:MAG: twin-arginine translocase TatA/TatE family subunit [Acidimicrobiia bacterium]|nr:twin-arginine translocase TatA/TatE family subunit [Acidimicrobiia bacterium]